MRIFDEIWEEVVEPAIHKEAECRGVDPYLYEEFAKLLAGMDKWEADKIQSAVALAVGQAMEMGFYAGWKLSKTPDKLIFEDDTLVKANLFEERGGGVV